MLNQTTQKIEIAARLYDNNTYGTTYGKGMYRKAIYNGTIDAKHLNIKYIVDLYSYDDWANMAKTNEQMEILLGSATMIGFESTESFTSFDVTLGEQAPVTTQRYK